MLRHLLKIFLLTLIAVAISADGENDSEITKFMKYMEVIPDVLSDGPKDFLKITYDTGVFADKGVELTPTQVKNAPTVDWQAEPNTFYTLIMTDPDAPSRKEPKWREWHHWLVVNIPGKDLANGEVLTAYVGAGPPKDTDLHRYVLLVFKQSKKLEFDEKRITNTDAKGREGFSTRKFIAKYDLGTPIAGNFFQAKYDDFVPQLYQQLGFES